MNTTLQVKMIDSFYTNSDPSEESYGKKISSIKQIKHHVEDCRTVICTFSTIQIFHCDWEN